MVYYMRGVGDENYTEIFSRDLFTEEQATKIQKRRDQEDRELFGGLLADAEATLRFLEAEAGGEEPTQWNKKCAARAQEAVKNYSEFLAKLDAGLPLTERGWIEVWTTS